MQTAYANGASTRAYASHNTCACIVSVLSVGGSGGRSPTPKPPPDHHHQTQTPTGYLKLQNVPVAWAKTGVKFVHHEAEKYDLGALH